MRSIVAQRHQSENTVIVSAKSETVDALNGALSAFGLNPRDFDVKQMAESIDDAPMLQEIGFRLNFPMPR